MTRIPPATELLALLRQQAIDLQRQAPQPSDTKPLIRDTPERDAAPEDPWTARVAQSIAAIRPDDPQRRRKAFRAFLEAGLARELGIEDAAGAAFRQLVDTVEEGMLGNAGIAEAIDRAGDLLLRSAHPFAGL